MIEHLREITPMPLRMARIRVLRYIKRVARRLMRKPYRSAKKVLYFDISTYALVEKHTGIQRVVEQFMKYLPEVIGDEYELICLSGIRGYHIIDPVSFAESEEFRPAPKKGDIFLSIDLNHEMQLAERKTLRKWKQKGCCMVICVHDIVFELYPEFVALKEMTDHLHEWLGMITKNADGILCVSQSVQSEVEGWIADNGISNPGLKIDYFHHGADFSNTEDEKTFAASSENNKPGEGCESKEGNDIPDRILKHDCVTYIMVSTIEPRKGYNDAIEAFLSAAEQRDDISLVIVGRRGWKYEDTEQVIKGSGLYGHSLFWMDDCDDELLSRLYGLSDYYISSSYYEGFGLGIIEAAHRGLPLILRDIPVHREVSAGAALYFKDKEELADIMLKLRAAGAQNQDLTVPDPKEVPCLTWRESVQMAWNGCKRIKDNYNRH